MFPPISDAPETVKLDEPALLLIVPSKSKLATVWVACKSNVAPELIIKSVEFDNDPVNFVVPPDIVVSPEYELVPDKVIVPPEELTVKSLDPEMSPLNVAL